MSDKVKWAIRICTTIVVVGLVVSISYKCASTLVGKSRSISEVVYETKKEKREEAPQEAYKRTSIEEDEKWKGSYEESIAANAKGVVKHLDSAGSFETCTLTEDADGNTGVTIGDYTVYYDEWMSFLYISKKSEFSDNEKKYLDPSGGILFEFVEEDGEFLFLPKSINAEEESTYEN